MPKTNQSDRARRHHRLLELLEAGEAGTQEEIVAKLRREGMGVTQATVSRDLEELGAVRRRAGHRIVYRLADQNGPPSGIGIRMLPELVIDLIASGNLVVVKTFPGMAPTVGAVIDQAELDGAIGTVAGDDTVLVVAGEGVSGKALAKRIRGLSS